MKRPSRRATAPLSRRALLALALLLPAAPAAANEWLSCVKELRTIATGKGVSAQVFDTAFAGVEPDADILKAFDNQPEFTIPIWDYLSGLVDDERVADGRALMEKWAAVLAQAEEKFGVDRFVIAAVWGVLLLIGVSLDSVSPWRPLAPLARPALAADSASSLTAAPAVVVANNAALETAVAQAAVKSRPALVYFTAEWCVSCRVMEREVFQNDEVLAELGAVELIKVDVTRSTPEVRDLLDRYGVVGPPTMIFLSRTSKEVAESRLIGEASARAVLTSLERAGAAE
jgi:thiol-disulfide isomerase/thioredoxin